MSAPTNDDAAEISSAIRDRLKARGEITGPKRVYAAIDQCGQQYDLTLAEGDRVRLFRKTWGSIDGRNQQVGNNGDVVTVVAQDSEHLTARTKEGQTARIEWQRLADTDTNYAFQWSTSSAPANRTAVE